MAKYLYIIGPQEGDLKIGFANSLKTRLENLQVGNSKELQVIHSIEFKTEKEARAAERLAHIFLDDYKVRGEWFNVTKEFAIGRLNQIAKFMLANSCGVEVPVISTNLDLASKSITSSTVQDMGWDGFKQQIGIVGVVMYDESLFHTCI